jgi:hypothetical protein
VRQSLAATVVQCGSANNGTVQQMTDANFVAFGGGAYGGGSGLSVASLVCVGGESFVFYTNFINASSGGSGNTYFGLVWVEPTTPTPTTHFVAQNNLTAGRPSHILNMIAGTHQVSAGWFFPAGTRAVTFDGTQQISGLTNAPASGIQWGGDLRAPGF